MRCQMQKLAKAAAGGARPGNWRFVRSEHGAHWRPPHLAGPPLARPLLATGASGCHPAHQMAGWRQVRLSSCSRASPLRATLPPRQPPALPTAGAVGMPPTTPASSKYCPSGEVIWPYCRDARPGPGGVRARAARLAGHVRAVPDANLAAPAGAEGPQAVPDRHPPAAGLRRPALHDGGWPGKLYGVPSGARSSRGRGELCRPRRPG